jgi:hypothetical protein
MNVVLRDALGDRFGHGLAFGWGLIIQKALT